MRKKAFQFLDRDWCSIYLILDEQEFDKGYLKIEAYFTLSHKSLLSEGLSKTKTQEISGGFKDAQALHFVLIGHLGKYIEENLEGQVTASDITSKEILDYAFETIRASSNLIPCRFVLVECSEHPKVKKVYTDYEFAELQKDGTHYQYYKRI